MKPAVIYSYIVATLRNCRSGHRGWAASCDAARNLNIHTFECILAECKEAVAERRDIANFRDVCEKLFEKVLRMRMHLAEADSCGINPMCRKEMIQNGLMMEFDHRHPADEADADPKGLQKSFERESNII